MTLSEASDSYGTRGYFENPCIPFQFGIAEAKHNMVNITLLDDWYYVPNEGRRCQSITIDCAIILLRNGVPTVEKTPINGCFERTAADIDIPFKILPKKEAETPNVEFRESPKPQIGQLTLFS